MEFFVESNEDCICPICGAPLAARDHKKRVWKKERGEKSWVMIRRLVCTNKDCNHLHNELPDFLIPYKHYEAQLIEDVIEETITEDDVVEMDYPSLMTIRVWMEWFQRNIHILETPEVINGRNYWVKSIRFKVPLSMPNNEEADTFEVEHRFQPKEGHVETVIGYR
ncbi:MAG: DUF6431 domain-containing protein [Eubacterium sp.]|nr:DUF6431 domain-containing protein [Eubacterium sp.]